MKESTIHQLLGREANGWTLPKPHHIYAKTFRNTTNLKMQNNHTNRKTFLIRALMDPGSQFTALLKSTAKQLSLNGPKQTLILGTSGAQQLTLPNQTAVEFQLSSLDDSYVTNFNVEAITMPEVTYDISPITIDPKRHEHLKDVQFTEKLPMTPKTPKRVELLVGEPYTSQLLEKKLLIHGLIKTTVIL